MRIPQKNLASLHTLGFTLVELVVSIAIMTIILSVVLFNYKSFNSGVILNNLAYDIGLSVRKAQSYGVTVKGKYSGVTQTFTNPYGIHFNMGNDKLYVLFIDNDTENGMCKGGDSGTCASNAEKIEQFNIKGPYSISKLCTLNSSGTETCYTEGARFDITYKRPNPDARVMFNGVLTTDAAVIYVAVTGTNDTKKIIIRQTGQISVE